MVACKLRLKTRLFYWENNKKNGKKKSQNLDTATQLSVEWAIVRLKKVGEQ